VSISLTVLGIAARIQLAIFTPSSSVVLLADLIDNSGDALAAIPLGIAFFLGESLEVGAGLGVVRECIGQCLGNLDFAVDPARLVI
jgi:hypothetical protein